MTTARLLAILAALAISAYVALMTAPAGRLTSAAPKRQIGLVRCNGVWNAPIRRRAFRRPFGQSGPQDPQ